ncbi:TFIID_30kDa domain-containing protein [Cephalotus follicularis]|uniref:Transcription initiation factor TFIID subunit 10 n=1 Tax=Cephalotus follicularis TaxID=3775 RepID=A0A1Q3CC62_CEPFO|nr:TFIID_30kDa domain-containing protein [Cephalotus follicularis]
MNNMNDGQQESSEVRQDDDAALSEFLASLMDYTPTIPDELVEHYLGKSGFQCPDVRLIRLVAVATQKFVAEVANDALQHCKARQASVVKDKRDKQQKDKRLILTMDDLSKALREYGVNVKHQEYFADSPSTGIDPASREEMN